MRLRPICWTVTLVLAAFSGAHGFARKPSRSPTGKPVTVEARNPTRTHLPNPSPRPPRPTLVLQVGHSGPINSVAVSPDGKTLATGSLDTTVRIWDMSNGQLKATLQGYPGEGPAAYVGWLAFSPDGKTLVTPSENAIARLWDAQTGQLKTALQWTRRGEGEEWPVGIWPFALALSPDGKSLATGYKDLTVRLWDAQTGQLKATLHGHTKTVFSLAFSPDAKTLASGGWDQTVRLWDVHSGRGTAILRGGQGRVHAISFSPDGRTLATGHSDQARLWDARTGQLRAVLNGHTRGVMTLVFSPGGKSLATGSYDGTVRLWDAQTGQLEATLQGHSAPVQIVVFSRSGETLATVSPEGVEAWLWNARTAQGKAILDAGGVFSLAFSPDGKTMVTGSWDAAVRLWDTSSGQIKRTLPGQAAMARSYAFSPDGKTLARVNEDGAAWVWDVRTGQLRMTLSGHKRGVEALAFSPDGKMLVTGSPDQTTRLWDAESGSLKATLQGRSRAFAFSPDGKMLATGGGVIRRPWLVGGEARVWDTQTGQPKATLRGQMSGVGALAFSPDGTMLATGGGVTQSDEKGHRVSSSGHIELWDTGNWQLKATLQGHTVPVTDLAFSPDGKTLASVNEDVAAQLWDVSTGQTKAPVQGIMSGNSWFSFEGVLAFSSDGKALAKRDGTGWVTLWDVATAKAVLVKSQTQLIGFPPDIAQPVTLNGAAVSLRARQDGRVLATMLPVPEIAEEAAAARPITAGARAAPAVDTGEWFVTTPEGYFDCSANAARFMLWNVNGVLYPAERYLRRFRRPDLVRKALRGERITASGISATDIPPAAQFVGLRDSDPAPDDPMMVTVEGRDDRDVKAVELLVNGRPLPPEQARPITVIAKPIEVGAKPILDAAKDAEGLANPDHRIRKRFTFRVPLPLGAEEIRLRAVVYDDTDLGSDPVEIVLRRSEATAVVGNLYVLSVGVSRYRNADGKGFNHLRFPATDARAIADRFRREGKPLYEQVHVRTLIDEQATAANVRAGLKWLQASVRSGQIDTAVIFLSGHGISVNGRYYFATHETDPGNLGGTTLSGRELREALGGKLRAKAVFLFVDTCHAGGLSGRNDDLAIEVGEGVFLLASSGGREYSYESEQWGHGAFTFALLRALGQAELARDGVLYFNALTYAVPDEVAALMKAAGRNESEQEPCVPLASRRLRVPIAQLPR